MKNKILILILLIFSCESLLAENLNIKSSSININKKDKLTIFENNVVATDKNQNIFKTNYAEYNKKLKYLESKGETTILTSEGYFLEGKNILFDNKNGLITSIEKAKITDLENNSIFLENFEYYTNKKFFKSIGNIKVIDSKNSSYNFSQIYIDEKKREIVGTDIKAYLNDKSFKINEANKPRIFANTVKIKKQNSKYTKSVFTLCDYREGNKCPPWSLQASNMEHDKKSKTIYYDNAVIKFYDLPIFYTPKLSHPDPTVDRRSGFLPPSFSNSKNLGSGIKVPYYWTVGKDKDFTLTTKLFSTENPLYLGEYRHALNNSNLILDFGYTKGYNKTSSTKIAGEKSHFFSKFTKNFISKNNSENNLEVSLQEVSNDKYLKLYKIETNLVEYEKDILENSLNFTHENEDLFFGLNASIYENLKENYNDKYEYILPDVVLSKNLFSSLEYGSADFQSNFKIHNYDTNKISKFFVNDIDWKSKNLIYDSGIKSGLVAKLKNINYESNNISDFKSDPTSELFGAIGYTAELDLFKKTVNNYSHFLKPKALLRYAPGHMRKEENGLRLNHFNVFDIDRLNTTTNFESGMSSTLGFDYKIKKLDQEFNFSGGQIINQKENKNMPSTSSLDEKLSDFIGAANINYNKNLKFSYNFSLDQNYKDLNYNEIGGNLNFNPINFDFNYLQEKKHIGNQKYIKAGINLINSTNGVFSAQTKRNLVTNSSEYYDLSYEYINDCLKAGLIYRREFYHDSELESQNSLMFKITLVPFGNINTPSINQ